MDDGKTRGLGAPPADGDTPEERLRQSESRLRTITEHAPDTILQVDREGIVTFVNRPVPGLRVDQIIGTSVYRWLPEEQHEVVQRAVQQAIATGQRQEYESAGPGPAGEVRHYAVRVMPVLVGDRIDSAIYIATDFTGRRRAELALRESVRSLKTLMGNLPGLAYRCANDPSWTMEYVSEGATALTGYPAERLVGDGGISFADLMHDEDRELVWDGVQEALAAREKFTLQYRIRRADGQERWVWEQGQGVFDDDGELLALEGFITDITERQLLEGERAKSQKLESIGTLAGGIAHDFNNLLQGVFGYISLAREALHEPEELLDTLQQAELALHQAVSLTSQLLAFSKGGKPLKTRLEVRPLVTNAARFALSGSRARFRFEAADDLWAVEADAGQISQVVQNIVLNADQAMAGGGSVDLEAFNVEVADSATVPGLEPGRYVAVAVSDTGVGIPAEHLHKIFDPYFTTKARGSGLGLATSYAIARNHGGLLRVESSPGEGSRFTLYLPASAAAAAPHPTAPAPVQGPRGRILVMDDEPIVRRVTAELVSSLGHVVETAEHGEQAVASYRAAMAAGTPFDVVILDLTVRGGMGGAEALQQLRAIDPAVKAIVSSGYSDDTIVANHAEHGFRAFLKKPYGAADLQRVLSGLLG